ncbi:MAG: energy transducer TonB [Terracidiphilus sp.]|nr:energy transducer TonB [Terracidiphilus sp.]
MRTIAILALLSAMATSGLLAQTDTCCIIHPMPHRVRVSAELAEKMLIHKADLVSQSAAMPARVTGTVVTAILIDTQGNVVHSTLISGPLMLQKPVLDALRKYKYNPCFLNDAAVEMVSAVSVTIDSYRDCHIE